MSRSVDYHWVSSRAVGWDLARDARKASYRLAVEHASEEVMYGNGHRVKYIHRASDGHLAAIVRRTFEVISIAGPSEESANPEGG